MDNSKNDLKGEFVLSKDTKTNTEDAVDAKIKTPKAISKNSLAANHNSPHFFSSFSRYPDGVVLQNQELDEEILLLIRRHFITNFPWLFISLLAIVFPFLLIPLLPSLFSFINLSGITQTFIASFYFIIIFGYILVNFSIWYFNVALVTNKRIVDLDVTGILFRNIAETNLNLIQDISYTQNGSIRSIFNYGDVLVQTAGTLPNFEFDRAPRPAEIIRIISDLIGK